jgi:hypothetical protein
VSKACSGSSRDRVCLAAVPHRRPVHDDKGSSAIRTLFGLGLFSDVRLQINGDVLV